MTLRRRTVIALAAALALPARLAFAQSDKVYRVGLVSGSGPGAGLLGPALVEAFANRGYVVGKNIAFDPRAAQGKVDRLHEFVDDLVANHVDLIMTGSYPAAVAAKQGSADIPVVVTRAGDPVETGLVASLAHPGGNITGVSEIAGELSAKRLALLKEAMPKVDHIAVLYNADDRAMTLRYEAAVTEAKRLDITVVSLGVREPNDFDTAFAAMKKSPPGAILMVTDSLTLLNRKRVIDFAAEHRLPAIYEYDSLVHDGGLIAYGPNVAALDDRAVGLADRILKGAKPADLPLELPTRFDLAVNLKTAKALGLDIPQSVLLQATDVIE